MLNRYACQRMQGIWSEENQYKQWVRIEWAVMDAWYRAGVIPEKEATIIRLKTPITIDLERIKEIEEETRHDVVAFTRMLSEKMGPEKRWIHYGLTSSDIVDTGNALRLKEANQLIRLTLGRLVCTVAELAGQHKETLQIGRTHGIHGEPISFGLKLAGWYANIRRDIERFDRVSRAVEVGMVSGAMGSYSGIPPEIEKHVCEQLGLKIPDHTTQVMPRDLYADYISTIALISTNVERYAVEIRHLQKTEVLELEEGFTSGQKGSSAMPHKKNPIGSENVTGIARLIRGHMHPAMENIVLWHERDISHSSVERHILPDVTSLFEYQVNKFDSILRHLTVNKERMRENINTTKGLIYSQRVLNILIGKGMTREDAYDTIQPLAMECWDTGRHLKSLIRENPSTRMITEKELDTIFSNEQYLKHVDAIYDRLGLSALIG